VPSRLAQLAARRRALVAESDALRAQLSGSAGGLRGALAPGPLGNALLAGVRRHPVLTVGAAVALVALRPRRIWKILVLGAGTMTLVLRAGPVLSAVVRLAKSARRAGQVRH
jgi:hypothetical protein